MVTSQQKIAGIIACLLGGSSVQALAEDSNIFTLGEIVVTAPKDQNAGVISDTLLINDMRKFNRETIGSALNLLPGITLSNNSRNEQMISVRGYDIRQVPLFIDGIPVYVPYDGYVDMGRFTTSDLAAIQVSKGYSSVSFGPNTLGGAINLVSRKPTKALEGDARIGYGQQNTHEANFNIGTNQGNWYAQAGVSYRDSDGFRLSDDFKPTTTEKGGQRDNSQYQDSKVSLKFGLTPNETDEYALSYYKQDGEKGNPPITDTSGGGQVRFWKWPQWDKESLYFISKTAVSGHETLKLRLFNDQFDNTLKGYTNNTYSTLLVTNPIVTGVSIYHDKTNGGMVELESTRIPNNTLRLFTEYKVDKHESLDRLGVTGEKFEDTLRSLAVEDAILIGSKTTATFGFAHHEIEPDKIYKTGFNFTAKKLKANDPQAAISYQWSDTTAFYASAAQKTRLPTLKDRYSLRLGSYIESPNLTKEKAHNYEIGYKGNPWSGTTAQVAIFQNDIDDKIQSVNLNGAASCSTTNKCQNQNVGEVRIRGVELSLNTALGDQWQLGGNITNMDIKNLKDDTKITGVPETKITTNLTWTPVNAVRIIGFAEYNSSRWVSNTAKVDGFTIMNLKAAWQPVTNLTAEVGVNNLTDKNYYLDFGFPNPGRMWFTNLSYLF
ncbi:TonB-dependent receptor plug domain-containing protein [Methylophilus aquaticus]|uniref:TonB-dependent receptor n=1 Tax=Methylophilus aquaticus TaxID=1971610 RepID=A0ABT9JP18_9PROT|nr:TonB-dependent receptor [Methylophilus aquaticus]MDP8566322.1 TonB-dependent receptor [Methylophilus aquaticus]